MESSTMCSKVDELSHSQAEEEEENSNELSTTPDSYPEYIPRFTFNKRQKSSLGKFRLNRLGATQPIPKIEANDDHSEDTDRSQYTGPFSIKTHTGISWMRETPGKNVPSVTFGSESASEAKRSVEEANKMCNYKSEKYVNISENDSGLDISYPSNIFSNTKKEGAMSIFKPTVCKRNILFNTPFKDSEDKENLFHTSDGADCANQRNPIKNTQQSARLGLFGNKATNNFDEISDLSKPLDIYSSSGIERQKQPFETNPERVSLFNQKSYLLKNIPVTNNTPAKEYKENEIPSESIDDQKKITFFDSKPNLFENKNISNAESNGESKNSANLKDNEMRSQENQKMDIFNTKPKVNDNQELSGSTNTNRQHLATSMRHETHRVPYNTQLAHGTIFDKPFTTSLKPETDIKNVSDDSLSTPLDLSSGEHLNKTNFNNSEQSVHSSDIVSVLKNSVSNTKETVSLTDSGMDNVETVNDSGINVTDQDKVNVHDHLLEPEIETNLLPTPLVLACPRSKPNSLFNSGGSSALKIMNPQPDLAEHSNNMNSDVKHTDQHISSNSHNLDHTLLKFYKIQSENPFLQSGLSQESLNSKRQKPEYQPHLNMKQSLDIAPKNNQLILNANLISVENDPDLNQYQSNTNSTYQSVSNQSHHHSITKPEVEAICTSKQIPQNLNMKATKSDVPGATATPQKQYLKCENIEMSKSQIAVHSEIFPKSASYHNAELHKPETMSVIPQLQSLNKMQNSLGIHSSDINKHHLLTAKSEHNNLHAASVPQLIRDQKIGGVQLFSKASFHSDKLSSKDKPEIAVTSSENHQNLSNQSSVIDLSGKQLPTASAQSGTSYSLKPNTSNSKSNSALFSTVPFQQFHPSQQSVSHQQQSSVNNMHYKPLVQQENPVTNFGNQSRSQVHQSTAKLQHAIPHFHSANSAQSYNIKNNDFIKPSNPAPRYNDCLPTLKNKQAASRPIPNRQSNFSIIPGMSTQMNRVLYVNGKAYTVLSILGKGGSSEVYQVIDTSTSTLMAVKCVDLTMVDQTVADGYLNEIDLLSKLQGCATVIKMFDHEYVKDTKMLYVVMEKGDTDLSKLIRDVCKTTKISISMMLYYWTEMLAAVRDIHERGIIHSDLKPANFLLVSGRLKLIDFGIASSLQGDMTSVQKEVTSGTWNYMSPEAIRNTGGSGQGYKITYRSDVWSLGCILYNLVYGKTPFSHITHTWSKLHAIADPNHKIEFPFRNIPPVLDRALKSCFHRDPKQRPTVAQLLEMPYQTTVNMISLGLEVKKLLPAESWITIQHLFPEAEKQENGVKTETTS